jgi:multidrug efflux pump subunit AcrB
VTFGLALTRNPLSLFTMYGVIALAGIAVNSAIVLIDAANDRRARGMGTLHAVVWAARRRVVPIIITSTTTIGGLFALATGIGGKSLLWGPVAASIVWGLTFSTVLTLYIVPLLYLLFMGRKRRIRDRLRGLLPTGSRSPHSA